MAKVLTDNKHYNDIADAIRAKNGTDNTYKPSEMADAIEAITTGGSDVSREDFIPDSAFVISGNCAYRFANGAWDWFLNMYSNMITTSDIQTADYMFNYTNKESIDFDINFKNSSPCSLLGMFSDATKLKSIPKITNCCTSSTSKMFNYCHALRHLPEDIESYFDWSYMEEETSGYSCARSSQFTYCYSLRSIPMSFLSHANKNSATSYSYFYTAFQNCYALDELVGLPIPYIAAWTSNAFNGTFSYCYRLKNATFATPNGQPYVMQWKSQVIDLSLFVGYANSTTYILYYNSGITADKEVKDDATYQALKDDPDWFATKLEYSRYNHDSAVATINSLPDTSAYGTNIIKFKGAAGSATDGGAINTLTEEEIAVAAAKGWTVTLS